MHHLSLLSVNLSESRQPDLYAATIVPGVFAFVCVCLRFWSCWTNRAGFWVDDWLILCALVCAIGLWATAFWWIPRALGKQIQTLGPNVVEDMFIGLFSCELTYTGVIVFVKFSILALYWRIFSKTNFKIPIAILSSFVFMWGTSVCIPTRGFWDKYIVASCNVDSQKFLFAISIPNILLDVTLLALPAPYVIRLHISTSQKRAPVSIFALGGFVCIASIMRLIAVITQKSDPDMTWNLINQATWAVVEVNFAIISACLPTLRPVWLAVRQKSHGTKFSEAYSHQRIGNSVQKQKTPTSWTTEVVKSQGDDEFSEPLSATPNSRTNNPAYGPEDNSNVIGTTVTIPLPALESRVLPGSGTIHVQNIWDVQHSERTQLRCGI